MIKIQQDKKFEAELEKIRRKATIKKIERDRTSLLYIGPNRISKDLNFSKDIFSSPTIRSMYSTKSVSPCAFRHKNIYRKAITKNYNNIKNVNINNNRKKRGSVINDSKINLGYQKSCKSFNFKLK